MGPLARDVLAAVTDADVSNAAFPFGHVREITIAGPRCGRCASPMSANSAGNCTRRWRKTGEVFDALMAAGAPHGLRPVGYRALESLRLEKGYRAWGSDITPNDTPFEAGLGWAVKLKKNTPFLGRAALEAASNKPQKKVLATFTTEREDVVLLGRETILRDGQFAGYLTSGGYGYTIGRPIGLGYLRKPDGVTDEWVRSGRYELVVAGETVPAQLTLEPLYDPSSARVKS
jgi:sarcosine dehydrogenase